MKQGIVTCHACGTAHIERRVEASLYWELAKLRCERDRLVERLYDEERPGEAAALEALANAQAVAASATLRAEKAEQEVAAWRAAKGEG